MDNGLEYDDEETTLILKEQSINEDGELYFVLNVSKQTSLQNGFRYIKEILLQHHNFKTYSDFKLLNENEIKVYSVKTDASTIHKNDADKIKSLLHFPNNIEKAKKKG